MDEILEILAIAGLGAGAFALLLAGVGRLMLWLIRQDIPPSRDAFNPIEGGNPHQGAFGMLAHMLWPGSILVVAGIAAAILRGASELL